MRQFGLILLTVLMFSSPLQALEAEHHEALTTAALLSYKTCQGLFPAQLKAISANNKSAIAAASGDIDRFSLLHLRRSLSRLWNWHFYDAALADADHPQVSIKRNWLQMNRSLHRTFVEKTILASQRRQLADEQFFVLSGEVLHFVQDMGVPAHVVPIYHGTFKRDDFDYYVFSGLSGSDLSEQDLKNKCKTLVTSRQTPEQILNKLAQNTRQAIAKNIAGDTGKQWTMFWDLSPQAKDECRDGFYSYGQCGNVFDQAKHQMSRLPQVCRIEAQAIEAFYAARYQEMLDASLAVLVYLNRK
ncbi:MAG: hypothetical protein Q9M16_05545 [Mariprofundus sp.]|nr:hypothetical protein [Mariprofundus sp.]